MDNIIDKFVLDQLSVWPMAASNFRDLKNELDDIEGNDTYRMELTSLRARMDPAWY